MDFARLYQNCLICPRSCGVDRTAGQRGFCGETAELRAASAVLHRGEEPPISGKGGSGALFISGCNLGCVFCQNRQISQSGENRAAAAGVCTTNNNAPLGRIISAGEFAEICLKLQSSGAENINIVTGSHATPAIIAALITAKEAGLHLPVLWNSSAYESPAALELLRDHIDIYLPDLKTLDSGLGARFFSAPGYPRAAAAAILAMLETRKQVIIRHLVLPGYLDSTRSVLRWFADNARGRAMLSLMTQYTPIAPETGQAAGGTPARFLSAQEYETVLGWLEEFGIEDGFCQELVTGSDWLPDFNRANPFSAELSVPVWHWRTG
jgi:putative pyruvate formate lyase activating enzyme